MGEETEIKPDAIPRLPRGVRLKHDATRDEWLLLAPERVVKPNPSAIEILKRCDGKASVADIVAGLAAQFSVDAAIIDRDVRALLGELAGKRMVDL